LCNTEFLLVPTFGEGIAVVDEAVSGVDTDFLATDEVLRFVEFFFFKRHSWVMSKDWDFGKLLSGKEKRENILSVV